MENTVQTYNTIIIKWNWMADYCKKMLWNPHDSYFWSLAEKEYYKQLD